MLDLTKFDQEITKYTNISNDLAKIDSQTNIGWLQVNSQPIKTAMISWVMKWTSQYTTYLHNDVRDRLLALKEFMDRVVQGLDEEVNEQNKEALMRVITHIRDVRKLTASTAEMFQPLREAVQLLKSHGVNIDETKIYL